MNRTHVFIVGIQRSGTSYLAHILDDHPSIRFARPIGGPPPEPKFFINEYKKGREFYESKYFANRSESVWGEKSAIYAEHLDVPERIHAFYPSAKIIFMLRNPVERAISNYFLSVRSKKETRPIEAILENSQPPCPQDVAMSPYDYIARGDYCSFISRYEQLFSDIKILISEETFENIESIQSTYDFLGVDCDHVPSCLCDRINHADRTIVPAYLVEKLQETFEPNIKAVEEKLGKEVTVWRIKA